MSRIISTARRTITRQMAKLPGAIALRVDGTVLFQSVSPPHDIIDDGGKGSYPRVEVMSGSESLSVMGATEGAQLYKVRPVGDLTSTPTIGVLMDSRKSWEIRLGVGANFVPARAVSITPDQQGVGWDVVVEVFAQ